MHYGFIKVAAATPKIKVADCKYNAGVISGMIAEAADLGCELAVFPELCITGYTCLDLFLHKALTDSAEAALGEILTATKDRNIIAAVGLPVVIDEKLYNCAAIICRGKLLGLIPKENIPNYSEFQELRHFTPADPSGAVKMTDFCGTTVPFGQKQLFKCAGMRDFVLACEICEDLWVPASPSVGHAAAGATVIINLSASSETIGKAAFRRSLVSIQSAKLLAGYVYSDAGDGESTTDLTFSGHSIIAENGKILAESTPYKNGITVSEIDVEKLIHERKRINTFAAENDNYHITSFELDDRECVLSRKISRTPFVPNEKDALNRRAKETLSMQVAGLAKRIEHIGCKTAVIGISGGLDSSLALIVTVMAMDKLSRPRTDIIAVTMPCFATTARTKSNAVSMCELLGVTLREVDITASVSQHFADIGQSPDKYDVTFENAQARERTQVIMDIANMTGGIVVGTGDLSELALGWATYNGDHMSMYGVNASIPKTLVRHLVRCYADTCGNSDLSATLYDVLDTPVSPELIPGKDGDIAQKTEDIVGPYELHDFFLYHMMRSAFDPDKILFLAEYAFGDKYSRPTLLKWLRNYYRRFFAMQFKRSCLPDGPKVGSVCFSPRGDWRMPSDASAALWLAKVDELK